jgi:hypothetical protein
LRFVETAALTQNYTVAHAIVHLEHIQTITLTESGGQPIADGLSPAKVYAFDGRVLTCRAWLSIVEKERGFIRSMYNVPSK